MTRVPPPGRTEVPVENGKYTVVIEQGSVSVERPLGTPWVSDAEVCPAKMLIAMACELERCRDLLWMISRGHDPENPADSNITHDLYLQIVEVLPQRYEPVTYK